MMAIYTSRWASMNRIFTELSQGGNGISSEVGHQFYLIHSITVTDLQVNCVNLILLHLVKVMMASFPQ
jgi:hypothetical protein